MLLLGLAFLAGMTKEHMFCCWSLSKATEQAAALEHSGGGEGIKPGVRAQGRYSKLAFIAKVRLQQVLSIV